MDLVLIFYRFWESGQPFKLVIWLHNTCNPFYPLRVWCPRCLNPIHGCFSTLQTIVWLITFPQINGWSYLFLSSELHFWLHCSMNFIFPSLLVHSNFVVLLPLRSIILCFCFSLYLLFLPLIDQFMFSSFDPLDHFQLFGVVLVSFMSPFDLLLFDQFLYLPIWQQCQRLSIFNYTDIEFANSNFSLYHHACD